MRNENYTHQIRGQVDKVCIVLVDELHHGILQRLEVDVQVFSKCLQLDPTSAISNKGIHIEAILVIGWTLITLVSWLKFGEKIYKTAGLVAQNFYGTGKFVTRPESK